jgi:hypothetical protein
MLPYLSSRMNQLETKAEAVVMIVLCMIRMFQADVNIVNNLVLLNNPEINILQT